MNMIEKRRAMAGQGGFTLIELLVVIAILAILAGAAIIGIGQMRNSAKKNSCKSEKDTIQTALEAQDVDNDGAGIATVASAVSNNYLKKVNALDWSAAYTNSEWVVTPVTTAGRKYAGVTGC